MVDVVLDESEPLDLSPLSVPEGGLSVDELEVAAPPEVEWDFVLLGLEPQAASNTQANAPVASMTLKDVVISEVVTKRLWI